MATIVNNDLSCILCEAYQGIFEVLYKYELLVVHSLVIIIENGWAVFDIRIPWIFDKSCPGASILRGRQILSKKPPLLDEFSDTLSLLTPKAKRFQFTRPRRGYNFRHSTPFPHRKQNVTFKRGGLQTGLQMESNTDLK